MFRVIVLAFVILFYSHSSLSQEKPIQPGDVLKVTVYGNPDLTTQTEVSNTGYLNMPLIGAVEIAGLISSTASEKN